MWIQLINSHSRSFDVHLWFETEHTGGFYFWNQTNHWFPTFETDIPPNSFVLEKNTQMIPTKKTKVQLEKFLEKDAFSYHSYFLMVYFLSLATSNVKDKNKNGVTIVLKTWPINLEKSYRKDRHTS